MDITGKIKLINDTKEYGSNGFRKRELVVTTEEQYPQDLLVEFIQDKCDILNSYKVGESVKVDINLRGREWESPQGEIKYFNSIHGFMGIVLACLIFGCLLSMKYHLTNFL